MNKNNIMPFHLFHHQGQHYVINIEKMSTGTVDARTSEALAMMASDQETLLPSDIEENLKKLGLVSEGWQNSQRLVKKGPYSIVNMALLLTQSCNLKCVYCYGDGGEYGTGGSMEEKTAFQAVDWLIEQSGKMKKIHLGFFGGEPFLNFPLMKAVVEYAEKKVREMGKEVGFSATTNGTLLDDEKIAFIKKHQFDIGISIDGPRAVHDAQRPYANGKGSYDSIVPKIKKLLEVMPDTLGHAVTVGNTDPQLVKDALIEIGFKKISLRQASPSLFNRDSDKIKSKRDISGLLNVLEQEAETWIHLTQSRDRQALETLKDKSDLFNGITALLQNSRIYHACSAGLGMVGVSAAGDVYLCHRFVGMDNYKIGSIFEHELNRGKYLISPTTSNEKCAACFAKYYCAGGCKHDNVGSCGSFTTPSEEICHLRCRELELAASIIGRLDPVDHAFLLENQIFPPKPCLLDF